MRYPPIVAFILVFTLLLVATLSLSPVSHAAPQGFDLLVTRLDDPPPNGCLVGDCSLREAIIAANGLTTPATISVTLPGTIELTIDGQDPGNATLGI